MKNIKIIIILTLSLWITNAQETTVKIVQNKSQKSLDAQVLDISNGELKFNTANGGPFKVKIADLTQDSVDRLRKYWQNRSSEEPPNKVAVVESEPSIEPVSTDPKTYKSIEISEVDIDARQIQKSYKSEFRKFGISYDVDDTLEQDKYGKPATLVEVYYNLSNFFSALDRLDPNFVKKSRVTQVFFKNPLIDPLSGKPVGGLGGNSGKMWFNSKRISAYIVYHELFHVFDDKGEDWSAWKRTNPKGFTYKGSKFRPEELSRSELRKNNENQDNIANAFVSEYAKSNQVEDRAETFTHMIIKGYHIMKQAENNEHLSEKIGLIVDLTSKSNLLGKDYWDTLLTPDMSNIKHFSESGLACRLIIDLRKRLLDPNAVIEVAGKTFTPLIFALEENNSELVKLLCNANVNHSVKNEKNLTPLQLAIENESEPQILALLNSGAQPTTDKEREYLDQNFDE